MTSSRISPSTRESLVASEKGGSAWPVSRRQMMLWLTAKVSASSRWLHPLRLRALRTSAPNRRQAFGRSGWFMYQRWGDMPWQSSEWNWSLA